MYLYAITDRPDLPVPAEPGLEGTSLFSLAYRDIVAVVSPLATTKVPPTGDNVWRHEAIVEALMTDRTVLPVRFGTVLADEATVQSTLAAHYADFVASLERVRGRVELSLRVLWDLEEQGSRGTREQGSREVRDHFSMEGRGQKYMLARLEEERQHQVWRQRAEALAEEIHAPLVRLAAESTRQVLITPRLLLTAAYLVERDRVATFRQEVEALSATYPALRFLCTGPWPTYNFVSRFPIDDVRFSI